MAESALMQAYLKEISALEKTLKDPQLQQSKVPKLQEQLMNIADKYQYDERIGAERYKIYELQGLIFFYQANDKEAIKLLDTAQTVHVNSYKYATSLQQQILNENPKIIYSKERHVRQGSSNVGFGVASIFLAIVPILGLVLGGVAAFSKKSSRVAVKLGIIGICLSLLALGVNTMNAYNRITERAIDAKQRATDVEHEYQKALFGE